LRPRLDSEEQARFRECAVAVAAQLAL